MNVGCLQWFSFHTPWRLHWDCTLHSIVGEVAAIAWGSVSLCIAVAAIRLQWHGRGGGRCFLFLTSYDCWLRSYHQNTLSLNAENMWIKLRSVVGEEWVSAVLSPLPCNQMSHDQRQCFPSPVKKLPYLSSK
jgi:hypothetical protein